MVTVATNARSWTAVLPAFGLIVVLMACGGMVLILAPPAGPDPEFWAPWAIGLAAAGVSGAVWCLRPGELATRLFLLVGVSFMVSLLAIAAHATPGDKMPRLILHINLICNEIFNLALLSLFLQYPLKLVRTRWVCALLALAIPYAAAVIWLAPAVIDAIAPFLQLQLLGVIGLIAWQWVKTRRAPRDRAALMWLALSVVIGISLWVVMLLTDMTLGGNGRFSSGAIALVLFFPFYLGLAMGVARFCLIALQDWTFRILFFAMAVLLFAAIDAALVAALGMQGNSALGVSLFVVAFAYLPLRDVIWRRVTQGRRLSQSDMFAAVLEIVFAPTPPDRSRRWRTLVHDLFQPLDIDDGAPVTEAAITDGGLRLVLPPAADGPPLVLSYAREGRGLFTPSQLALSRRLIDLIRTASQSRDAYERGAAEERRKLAQDLHDDVGARLLSGLNTADARTRPLIHAALGDIRAIVNGLAGTEAPLDRVLADMRHEGVRRLEAAGIDADWPLWPEDAPLVLLDYRLQKALGSAVREAVSNIIRHAGAQTVSVDLRLVDDRLVMAIHDDGHGLPETVLIGEAEGQGLKGMTRRLADVGGGVEIANRRDNLAGTQVELQMPLRL